MGFASRRTRKAEKAKVEALGRSGDVAGLIEAAGHADPRISAAAASSLGELGPRGAARGAIGALRHPADRVRCVAIRALYEWGKATPLAEAVFWLPRQGASRELALAAIEKLQQPETAPVLTRSLVRGTAHEALLEDELELVLILARSAGGQALLHRVIAVLVEALEDNNDVITRRAEDFLVWLGEDAVPAVSAVARSGAAPDRAVLVLGQIGGASVVEPLIEAIDHPDARTREEACVALGELGDPVSVEALVRRTWDREHGVRFAAAAALDRIGAAVVLSRLAARVSGLHPSSSGRRNGADEAKNGATRKSRSGPRVQTGRP